MIFIDEYSPTFHRCTFFVSKHSTHIDTKFWGPIPCSLHVLPPPLVFQLTLGFGIAPGVGVLELHLGEIAGSGLITLQGNAEDG
jgi:hypothetical protein